jgi:FkbM family methyltransferase
MTRNFGPLLRFGKLRFYLGDEGNVPPYHEIFFQGDYRCLTIRPNDIVLDAGANTGLFSIWAASRCRSVIAVEPAPETFNLLKLNKRINKADNVFVINKALSDHDGYVTMGGDGATFKIEQRGTIIASTTIDSLLKGLALNVDVVKMDVEGAERDCLAGSYLKHVREIAVETHSTENSVVSILESYGFRTTRVTFRVSRTLANILKKLPYFVSAELATDLRIFRPTLRAFMKREGLLLRERLPQYQIIHGRKPQSEEGNPRGYRAL